MTTGPAVGHVPDELRLALGQKQIVVVTGAGLSIDASGGARVASWLGLLRDGVRRCAAADPRLAATWAPGVTQLIDDKHYLRAADEIVAEFGGQDHGDFRAWMREAVGDLPAKNDLAISALGQLDAPLATTNYDTLIEAVTHQQPITWRTDPARLTDWIRDPRRRDVLHLHGCWSEPASIVMTTSSYRAVKRAAHLQTALRALTFPYSFLLVGFGAGVEDPHFRSLRRWIARQYHGSGYHHYRIVRASDWTDAAVQHHEADDRFTVLQYSGALADYLHDLRIDNVGVELAPPITVQPATAHDIERICAIDQAAFQPEDLIAPERFASWQQRNPTCFWCIRQGGDQVKGYYSLLFLHDPMWTKFVHGQLWEDAFEGTHICTEDEALQQTEGYLFSVVASALQGSRAQVLNNIVQRLEYFYTKGRLRVVYATAATPRGEHLLNRFLTEGVARFVQPADERADGHALYRIDLSDDFFQNWREKMIARFCG